MQHERAYKGGTKNPPRQRNSVMRRLLIATIALLTLGTQPTKAGPFSFVALGDMPYYTPADYGRFERLIGRINQPTFSIWNASD
jgi:hypothetical protein